MEAGPDTLRFGDFTLERAERRVLRGGREVELGSRYFDALLLLLQEPGALVTKDRFMAEVWRGIPVTDEALTQCIRTLRRALDDDAVAPRFIATVPKHGYRFVGEVVEGPPDPATRAAESGRPALAAALGGAMAGTLGGAGYGLLGASGPSGALVLALAGLLLGLAGGAGVGLGIALARLRGGGGWREGLGGALGGAAVGALGSAIGRDGVNLMTGTALGSVTGPFEGLVLGAAAGLCGVAVRTLPGGRALVLAVLAGAAAGGAIALLGGRMLGGTLLLVEGGVPASRLGLASRLAGLEGWLAVAEGAAFVAAVALTTRPSSRK